MGACIISIKKTDGKPGEAAIQLVYPSSIIVELFPEGKIFSSTELLKTILSGMKKCKDRVEQASGSDYAMAASILMVDRVADKTGVIEEGKQYIVTEIRA